MESVHCQSINLIIINIVNTVVLINATRLIKTKLGQSTLIKSQLK